MADSRSKSFVWEFFIPSLDNTAASCHSCGKVIKRPSGNTTNLRRHLESDHKAEFIRLEQRETERKADQQTEASNLLNLYSCRTGKNIKTSNNCNCLGEHLLFIYVATESRAAICL